MLEKNIKTESSLEARPAAMLVQIASKFKSNIYIKIDDKTANAKSIMGMISIGILDNQQITLIADGEDENAAISELEIFFRG